MDALNLTLPAQILRKASLHQSDDPTRTYINGVNVSPSHVVATDGHSCYVCELDEDQGEILRAAGVPDKGVTFKINGKIPLRSTEADIYLPRTQTNGRWLPGTLTTSGPTRSATKDFTVTHQDGDFPNWQLIVPASAPGEVDRFSFGGNLLKRIADTFQDFATFHRPEGAQPENTAWIVTDNSDKPDNDKIVVMPSRIS